MPRKKTESTNSRKKLPPALTPEAKENQMIALSMDVAEQMLRSGKPPAQVVTHFLKLGSMKEKLEREKIENENRLLKAKVESLQSQKRVEELYADAINAMKRYSGNYNEEDEYYNDDPDIF